MRAASALFIACTAIVSSVASGAGLSIPKEGGTVSSDGLWRMVTASQINLTLADVADFREPAMLPTGAPDRVYVLNTERLSELLQDVPERKLLAESTKGGREITLPLPDGTFARFSVYETPVVPPELAQKVPEVRTYSAVGIDDPAMTASIERTFDGWSAMVLSGGDMIFITHLMRDQPDVYVSVPKSEMVEDPDFECLVEGSEDKPEADDEEQKLPTSFGGTTRTYRLAMAATAEYTQYFRQSGDTDDKAKLRALGEIQKLVSRMNQVFGRDLAIQFTLVSKELDIVFVDAANDEYTNDNASKLLDENQKKLDTVIGNANYDIGHVVGTGGDGLATTPSACKSGSKARGETGRPKPTGDSFYIGYVAHEIGHQFGANHSFNGTEGECKNRKAATAYEPGSGSTIMGYAPLCGKQKVVDLSDSYFHAISLDEMIGYISSSPSSCASSKANGNRPPTVAFSGSSKVLIPVGTPFQLEVAGSDPDGDSLNYSWEQFDRGDPSPPDDDSKGSVKPMFRSVLISQPLRTFPSIANIVGAIPSSQSFESLPMKSSALTIRTIARDQRGGFAFADAAVSLAPGTGPFLITKPSSGTSWKSGQNQTITWNVSNTTKAPLSCANVKISISTDSGKSFTPLVANTPNDGSATAVAPNLTTNNAVVRIDCIGEVFFSASPKFTIAP
jgi:hypothetical protein